MIKNIYMTPLKQVDFETFTIIGNENFLIRIKFNIFYILSDLEMGKNICSTLVQPNKPY